MLSKVEQEILKFARVFLQTGARRTVCGAIRAATAESSHFNEVCRARTRLLEYVAISLDCWPSLGHWLHNRDGVLRLDEERLRIARIAWITWMLGELDENGPVPVRLRN